METKKKYFKRKKNENEKWKEVKKDRRKLIKKHDRKESNTS